MNSYKVLYAEDEDDIRERYVKILSYYFEHIYESSNGKEAYEMYLDIKPDILILDINMPILNGIELAQKIRTVDKKCKIILLSALSDTDTLIKSCELNLLKYLLKPIKIQQLQETIYQAIDDLDKINNKNLIEVDNIIKLDRDNSIIFIKNKQIKLTKNELILVDLIIKHKNRILTNDEIINHLWEDNMFSDTDVKNKLRVLIYRLNKKFDYDIINSIYEQGYKLNLKM